MTNQNLITKNTMQELSQTQSSFAAKKKQEALAIFNSIPMPNEKEEDWRYTNIEKFRLEKFRLADAKTKIIASRLSDDLAEKGVILTDISTAFEKHPEIVKKYFFGSAKTGMDKFAALSAACFTNGIFLYVPENIRIGEPIKADFHFEGQSSVLYNLIIAEQNSSINFIEEYSNSEISEEQLNACVTEVFAGNDSAVNFCHLNSWTKNAYNFTNIVGAAGRNASINWVSACFGGRLNRLKIGTSFNGQGSQCSNIGVFLGRGKEHIDFTTNVYHNAESTTNDILVDGILKDESSSVYRGLIRIPKEGQKTDSYLANHILKLGYKTLANSIPSLKIDANDVKASHGATVGQIDEERMFYLMSRGLAREDAGRMIVEGFFEPVIQKIPNEEVREKIREMVRK